MFRYFKKRKVPLATQENVIFKIVTPYLTINDLASYEQVHKDSAKETYFAWKQLYLSLYDFLGQKPKHFSHAANFKQLVQTKIQEMRGTKLEQLAIPIIAKDEEAIGSNELINWKSLFVCDDQLTNVALKIKRIGRQSLLDKFYLQGLEDFENQDGILKNSYQMTTFQWAIICNQEQEVAIQFTLKSPYLMHSDYLQKTNLFLSAEYNFLSIMPKLMALGCNINQPDADGETPLYIASVNGHKDVVQWLLEQKADEKLADTVGCRAFNVAAQYGHLDVVELLWRDEAPDLGTFYFMSQLGHLDIIKFLIENKADVNSAPEDDSFPLITASASGHLDVVKFLLEKGADPDKTSLNLTAFECARDKEIQRVILRAQIEKMIATATISNVPPYQFSLRLFGETRLSVTDKIIAHKLLEQDLNPAGLHTNNGQLDILLERARSLYPPSKKQCLIM